MTRQAIVEYIEAIRGRYMRANRKEKGRLLNEAMEVTGYHRKTLVRLLHRERRPGAGRRGRPRRYGPEVREALRGAVGGHRPGLWTAVAAVPAGDGEGAA